MRSYRTLRRYAVLGADGKGWYNDTVPAIKALSEGLMVSPQYLADVLAITSPRVQVTRNITIAVRYLVHGTTVGLLPGVLASLAHYEATGEIRGPKTSAFARAIMGDGEAIVLDTWMAKALNVPHERVGTKQVRAPAEALIRRVAKSLGWAPAEVQAAMWTHWVRTHKDTRGRRTYANAPSFAALLMAPQETS